MGDTQITTQSALGESNFILQEFANNLSAHSNASLSLSHGIDTFPALNPDSNNNDRTNFEDSHSNVVGTRHVRFVIDGVSYWAPALTSTLAGQPSGNNVTTLQSSSQTAGLGAGDDNWVTVFEQQSVDSITVINEDYLLPHTKLAHWETHGSMTVESQTTLDSGGYEIGDTVVKLSIGGIVYKIPTHTRFGGPAQWWSSGRAGIAVPRGNYNCLYGASGFGTVLAPFYYWDATPKMGTFPRTMKWQLNQLPNGGSATWRDIPNAGGLATSIAPGWTGEPTLFFQTYPVVSSTTMVSTFNQMYAGVTASASAFTSICVCRVKITGTENTRVTYTGVVQLMGMTGSTTFLPSVQCPAVPTDYVGKNHYA